MLVFQLPLCATTVDELLHAEGQPKDALNKFALPEYG